MAGYLPKGSSAEDCGGIGSACRSRKRWRGWGRGARPRAGTHQDSPPCGRPQQVSGRRFVRLIRETSSARSYLRRVGRKTMPPLQSRDSVTGRPSLSPACWAAARGIRTARLLPHLEIRRCIGLTDGSVCPTLLWSRRFQQVSNALPDGPDRAVRKPPARRRGPGRQQPHPQPPVLRPCRPGLRGLPGLRQQRRRLAQRPLPLAADHPARGPRPSLAPRSPTHLPRFSARW